MALAEVSGAWRNRLVVKRGFLEFEPRGSWLERRDARILLAGTLLAVVAVASEPSGELIGFPFYLVFVVWLALAASARPRELFRRIAAATPFIATAALAPWLGGALGGNAAVEVGPAWSASILLRAYVAVLLLSILTIAAGPDRLAGAMRGLRFPAALGGVIILMYRYLFLLADERRRLAQAQTCRSAGSLTVPRLDFYSKQLGVLFLRAYDRSARVHGAMEVRGFEGDFGSVDLPAPGLLDWVFFLAVALAFWAVRLRGWIDAPSLWGVG